jgi:hypothetical protein
MAAKWHIMCEVLSRPMKFDSAALPLLPTPQQLTELDDLLLSANELYRIYATLERHPRVQGSPRSMELFTTCREQLYQDILAMTSGSGASRPKSGEAVTALASSEEESSSPYGLIPDVEPADISKSVFETVRKVFQTEDRFDDQLHRCLLSAQTRKHLKLELQLKMIILSAAQRCRLLEDRYGFAKSKTLLFQGLRRQTTRFLSALNGEDRPDIDR